MRTIYLGNTHYDSIAGAKRTSRMDHRAVDMEREPEGEDMPVFDRAASGYHGEYARPYGEDAADAFLRTAGRGFKPIKVQTVDTKRNYNQR